MSGKKRHCNILTSNKPDGFRATGVRRQEINTKVRLKRQGIGH